MELGQTPGLQTPSPRIFCAPGRAAPGSGTTQLLAPDVTTRPAPGLTDACVPLTTAQGHHCPRGGRTATGTRVHKSQRVLLSLANRTAGCSSLSFWGCWGCPGPAACALTGTPTHTQRTSLRNPVHWVTGVRVTLGTEGRWQSELGGTRKQEVGGPHEGTPKRERLLEVRPGHGSGGLWGGGPQAAGWAAPAPPGPALPSGPCVGGSVPPGASARRPAARTRVGIVAAVPRAHLGPRAREHRGGVVAGLRSQTREPSHVLGHVGPRSPTLHRSSLTTPLPPSP